MSTPEKLAANRANSLHSTGPKTEEGKQASSRNATRHGLTGKQVVIQGEDPAAYEALRSDLMDAYSPVNAAETMLVEEIAQCFWRLQRARAIEAENFNLACCGADPVIGFNSGHVQFDRMRRYMTTIERAYHRAMQQLEQTQALRAKQQTVGFVSSKPKTRLTVVKEPDWNSDDRKERHNASDAELRSDRILGTTLQRYEHSKENNIAHLQRS